MARIRRFEPGDADALHEVFRRAILEGAAGHYSASQRQAWASAAAQPGTAWAARLDQHITWVAEGPRGPEGFMTMGRDGHLDLAFVLPEAAGTGLADRLHDRILATARELDLEVLTTEASLRAQPFFLRMGWEMTGRQEVELGGAVLENAAMQKRLT